MQKSILGGTVGDFLLNQKPCDSLEQGCESIAAETEGMPLSEKEI